MKIEIERKYLVSPGALALENHKSIYIRQGYLNRHPKRTVRIRITDEEAIIAVKSDIEGVSISRIEIETSLPRHEGLVLLSLIEENVLEKTRYFILYDDKTWEVDVYHGKLEGLIIAELELTSSSQEVNCPSWVTKEVTDNPIYKSSYLCTLDSGIHLNY